MHLLGWSCPGRTNTDEAREVQSSKSSMYSKSEIWQMGDVWCPRISVGSNGCLSPGQGIEIQSYESVSLGKQTMTCIEGRISHSSWEGREDSLSNET